MRLSAAISSMLGPRRRLAAAGIVPSRARANVRARIDDMNAEASPHPATLLELWDETPSMLGVRLSAPHIESAHRAPGQFLTLAAATPVAIASAPGHGLELLLKHGGTAHELLAGQPVGAPLALDIDGPSGHGYPLTRHAGKDLLLLGAGSGI